jgi:5-methylthioribose kinase
MELAVGNEAEVQAHLRKLGWIGAGEQLISLASAGEGNMNVTLRARLPGRSIILKQARPYVAKYPDIAAPVNRLDAEAAFYHAIAASPSLRQRTPALLGEDLAQHLLCLEDLGEGSDLTRWYASRGGSDIAGPADPGSRAQIGDLAAWLGELHGLDVAVAGIPANAAMRALNHTHIFEIPLDADNGVALPPALVEMRAGFAADQPLRREAARLGRIYLGSLGTGDHGAGPALLHGDYYPGSWLELADGSVAVIDPEFAFLGPPEFDVGVFMAHLIMAGCPEGAVTDHLTGYRTPPGFSAILARQFAAMEVIRRLLGVAQLPLSAGDATRIRWLTWAREAITR